MGVEPGVGLLNGVLLELRPGTKDSLPKVQMGSLLFNSELFPVGLFFFSPQDCVPE